jgi:hypothetical protein
MPKRVIDFDAMWASDKIAACAEWAQAEYAWFYGLADCCGCFELTNMRVIFGRVAAVRKNLSLERVAQVLDEFHDKGLLFRWSVGGKRYGHWTGSDVPGRLPPQSWRNRLERLAPPVPQAALEEYVAAHKEVGTERGSACPTAHVADGLNGSLPVGRQASAASREMIRDSAQDDNVLLFRAEENCAEEDSPVESPRDGSETATGSQKDTFEAPRVGIKARAGNPKQLKACLEATQAQGLDLDREGKGDLGTHTRSADLCLEEDSGPKEEKSPTEKSKSVCVNALTDSVEEKNKTKTPVEEIKTKPSSDGKTNTKHLSAEERKAKPSQVEETKLISAEKATTKQFPAEEIKAKPICAGGSVAQVSAAISADRPEAMPSSDDANPQVPAPRFTNDRTAGDLSYTNNRNAEADPMPPTPEFRENGGSRAIEGNPRVQGRAERQAGNAGYTARTEADPMPRTIKFRENDGSHAIAKPSATGEQIRVETLGEIWEEERGSLAEMLAMTPERLVRCRERLKNASRDSTHTGRGAAEFLRDFREAVRRAAATPFLCGAGPAGWRANFDWLVANDTNYLKILEGRYDSGEGAAVAENSRVNGHGESGAASSTPTDASRRDAGTSRGSGASKYAGPPSWIAERAAREESVRRELRVGAGPSLDCAQAGAPANGVGMHSAIRADVVERFRRRGGG